LPYALLEGLATLDLGELHVRRQLNFTISSDEITIIDDVQDELLRDSFVYGATTRLRAERLTALSRSPLSIVGRTIKLLKPRSSKTKSSSKSENPWLSLPARNITVIPFPARGSISAVRNNIKGTMVAWALVSIGFAPGI
jgi:hypothetical protein